MAAKVRLLPQAADDVRALDGSARTIVFRALKKLKDPPNQRGPALEATLSGCRKLVVGDRTYRIVL